MSKLPSEQHDHLVSEKKYRLFKWKILQKHKMPLLYIKDKLVESIEVLMYFNIMHPIKSCLFSWGFNGNFQHGIQFNQNIRKFYDDETEEIDM